MNSIVLDFTTIVQDIDEINEKYCEGCFVKQQLRKDKGKSAAHRFCIESCSVGDQLKFLGKELIKSNTKL